MRKLVWIGFFMALSALAQGRFFVEGVVSRIDLTFTNPAQFNMTLDFIGGVKELAGAFGLQGGSGIDVQQGTARFNLQAGVLFTFGRATIVPQAGLGFRAEFGGEATVFAVYAFGGIEYVANRNVSLVIGTQPTVRFDAGTTVFGMVLRAGLRAYP